MFRPVLLITIIQDFCHFVLIPVLPRFMDCKCCLRNSRLVFLIWEPLTFWVREFFTVLEYGKHHKTFCILRSWPHNAHGSHQSTPNTSYISICPIRLWYQTHLRTLGRANVSQLCYWVSVKPFFLLSDLLMSIDL